MKTFSFFLAISRLKRLAQMNKSEKLIDLEFFDFTIDSERERERERKRESVCVCVRVCVCVGER